MQPIIEPGTWSPILHEAVKAEELSIISYELKLDYDYWGYRTYIYTITSQRHDLNRVR